MPETGTGGAPYREVALERVKRIVLAALAGQDVRVYLYGSSARRRARPSSDIDVAVEPRTTLRPGVLARLREALEESSIPYEVEVVDLGAASAGFADRVRREGIVWRD